MTKNVVQIGDVANTIAENMTSYTAEVEEAIQQAIDDIAKDSAKQLKSAGSFKGSRYRKNWKVKREVKKGYKVAHVYNDKTYRLTHLLEHGHVVKNGTGRNNGKQRAAAYPHIAEINDKAQSELERRIEDAINNAK